MSTRALVLAALLLPLLSLGARSSAIIVPTYITVSNSTVFEGSGVMTEFIVNILLERATSPVEVDVSASPDTADTSDFVFTPVHVTLMPGMVATVTGQVVGDRRYELNEEFSIIVTPRTALGAAPQPGVITIVDDDADQAPRIVGKSLVVAEGNAGWRTVEIPLTRDRSVDYPLSISFQTNGGTPVTPATPWGDYRPANGTATFAAGQETTVVGVEVNGDTTWEPDTTFSIRLSSNGDPVITTGSLDVTLTNDDAPTVVTIDDGRAEEGRTGSHLVTLRASFDAPAPPNASVLVQVVGGTARAGEDFEAQTLRLVPPPGGTSVTFAVTIFGDTTPECDEGVIVSYQGMGTGDDTVKEAKLLIVDDDGPPADACADPFATRSVPVEPGPDAAAPTSPEIDAGPSDAPATEGPAPAADGCGCGLAGDGGGEAGLATLAFTIVAAAFRRRSRRRA